MRNNAPANLKIIIMIFKKAIRKVSLHLNIFL